MNRVDTIDKIVLLTERRLKLLTEYKASILAENADYIIDQVKIPRGISNDYDHWYLIEKSTELIKAEGNKTQIQKYLDKRKITKVYWRQLS